MEPLGTYPIRTFDDFRNVAQLYQYSRVILTALELDLFSAIGTRAWPIAALARRLKVSARGLDILCRNLAGLGLLTKGASTYRNAPLARKDLNRHSPAYRGAYLDLIKNHWNDFDQLTRSVRRGKPVDAGRPDDPRWRRAFTWAMHHRSRDQAARVARSLGLNGAETLLDLGGGPGTYALAFLAANASLRATVGDRPAALKVAREIAADSHARGRLSFVPMDFMQGPLSGRYDVVWLSNVIHIYSPAENLALFRKIAKVLNPGGRLLIHDAFHVDAKGLYPIDTAAFAVIMLLFTETGNTYPAREVMGWLRKAGYARVRLLPGVGKRKDGENGLLEGRKSSRP
jgi:SAM-dependent methyltransferase